MLKCKTEKSSKYTTTEKNAFWNDTLWKSGICFKHVKFLLSAKSIYYWTMAWAKVGLEATQTCYFLQIFCLQYMYFLY